MAILFRSIANVCVAAAFSLILAPPLARAQFYTLSSITGWWDYDGEFIRRVDPATGATISVKGITLPPGTYGAYTTGLAAHPTTGEFFALVQSAPTPTGPICQHQLVKFNPPTGAATIIGDTGVCFASLAFHTNGTLYGVTDGVPLSLFTLNTSDASTTLLISFGSTGLTSGAVVGGPALAFNPNDGLLYRSARFPPSGQIFQSINPNTLAVTDIPLSGSPTYEITALTHVSGNTFLGADTGNQLFSITSSGVRTLIGSLDHLARGLAFATMPGSVPLAALVDFDGDGKSDIGVYRDGGWFILRSSDGGVTATGFGGLPQDVPMPADYDGDGAVDIAVYDTSIGKWFVEGSTAGMFAPVSFGGAGFIPVPGDYDGDGKTDVAVYQASTGNWFVVGTSAGFFTPALNFGGTGFIPVPGDYDGDGKTDTAVYQQSTGNWFVVGTSAGFFTPALNFGGPGFLLSPGDYDGDGKADPGVYQSSTGNWFVLGSSAGFFTPALNFGGPGFIPVPGDYDGDGKTDVAVYQQSAGNWFVEGSTAGFFTPALNFGGTGFVPVLLQVTILRALGLL